MMPAPEFKLRDACSYGLAQVSHRGGRVLGGDFDHRRLCAATGSHLARGWRTAFLADARPVRNGRGVVVRLWVSTMVRTPDAGQWTNWPADHIHSWREAVARNPSPRQKPEPAPKRD